MLSHASNGTRLPRADEPHSISKKYAKLANQIIAPAVCQDDISSTPNVCPRLVVPRRYRRVLDFTVPASGKFSVIMSPNLFMPGYVTGGAASVIPSGAPAKLFYSAKSLTESAVSNTVNLYGKFSAAAGQELLVKSSSITDTAAVSMRGVYVDTTGPTTYNIFNNDKVYFHTVQIWGIVSATGLWTSLVGDLVLNPGVFRQFTSGTLVDAVSVKVMDDNVIALDDLEFSFQTTGQHTSVAGESFAPAFEQQISGIHVSEGRVISMAMKITNTSQMLQKGGNISIGRVPHDFDPFNSVSLNMSRLPENRRHQDAAEFGGYVFWMPEQDDEWTFDSVRNKVETYQEADYLCAHLESLTPASSFRLTFAWVVEFYTISENFPKVITPNADDDWREVQRLLVQMDAACCNPESAGMFKRFLDSGVQTVKRVQSHYQRNQRLYNDLMKLAQHIATMTV